MKKGNAGATLIEIVVSMAILGALVIPTCSSMVLAFRVNAKADAVMQAQLAVSSAVETLMAEGINAELAADTSDAQYDTVTVETEVSDYYPGVKITVTPSTVIVTENNGEKKVTLPCYDVTVTDDAGLVTVTTTIREGGGGT